MNLRRLSSVDPGFEAAFRELVAVETQDDRAVEQAATAIVDEVRARGDAALLEFTQRFDRIAASAVADLEIAPSELHAALAGLTAEDRAALEAAAKRIRDFHERQRESTWTFTEPDGTVLGQRIRPLASVGVYVPGGLAAYPSSVLMNVIPAQVAGVERIVMVSPTPQGQRNPHVLAAAALAGVSRVFAIGGAQAVAALAYGTQTVPRVDKIVGPGNAYVAAAKRRVFGVVGIDMIAGPSEILIICDGKTDPDWIAFDLFSQAEHDERAQAILLTPDAAFIDKVQAAIARLLPAQPRRAIIEAALHNKGAAILTRSLEEACELANRIAPEHLE
ncbi:MAG TPA: histidinol dehydrogenase, partial [Burkholderiaceae bacterium]|nr:histidinol dehydrogenase [Burkholderiaceae bacterium]